ncbi:hypothetical protein [Candidatus Vidania fulgoroideorum]
MSKKKKIFILKSKSNSGYFYSFKKNINNLKKFDPIYKKKFLFFKK